MKVRVQPDKVYWINTETGKLVIHWRFEDSTVWPHLDPNSSYPAPVPLFAKPAGGGSSKRIPQKWFDYTRSINTPEAWKALRRVNGGWINYAANKNDYEGGARVPDNPDIYPRTESITSIDNVHEGGERRNNATRINAFRYSDDPPALGVMDPLYTCYFRSIDNEGNIGDAPDGIVSYFPLLVDDEAWIPDNKLEYLDEPEEPPMIYDFDFMDDSYHNGAEYKNNPLDWTAIKASGVKGAIHKCWDAWFLPPGGYPERQHFDPAFLYNWNNSAELDLRGAYAYLRFETESWRPDNPAEQVNKAIDYIPSPRKAEDVFMLDVEPPAKDMGHISLPDREAMLVDALQMAEDKWPKKFIWLYSAQWWWNEQMPEALNPYFLEFPMVVAYYGTKPLVDLLPNGWPIENVIAHQWSESENIQGYPVANQEFDANNFLWDWDEYFDTANPTPPPDPVPPAPTDRNAILTEAQDAIEAIKD